MKYIDLHSHTRHSDGTSTVVNSLTEASKLGLDLFSVSDHNKVSAYAEIAQHRELFSGKILPAVELSTTYGGEVVEVLGYGIDIDFMQKYIDSITVPEQVQMEREVIDTTKHLEKCGVILADEFTAFAYAHPDLFYDKECGSRRSKYMSTVGGFRESLKDEIKRHPENAKFFKEGVFETLDRHILMRQYIANPKSELFIDKSSYSPSMHEIVDAIHKAGGLAFFAHTFVYSPSVVSGLDDIAKNYGLDGLECHYGTFTKEQKAKIVDYCKQNGLFMSGGSDFHGLDMRPKNIMGLSGGEKIEFSLIEPWFEKVKHTLI